MNFSKGIIENELASERTQFFENRLSDSDTSLAGGSECILLIYTLHDRAGWKSVRKERVSWKSVQ